MKRLFLLSLLYCKILVCYEFDIHPPTQETLFVSLGSWCEVAAALIGSELRNAAYPFDHIISFDPEKLLDILNDDFAYFLDPNFLQLAPNGPGFLLNDYYHLEFLHEGDFRQLSTMGNFQAKYTRRINRFRELANYSGKVVFIRTVYEYSMTDPHRHYFCPDNVVISDEYATRLYEVLKSRFPNLNFTLVILNSNSDMEIVIEKKLTDNLIKVLYHTGVDMETKKSFLFSLL